VGGFRATVKLCSDTAGLSGQVKNCDESGKRGSPGRKISGGGQGGIRTSMWHDMREEYRGKRELAQGGGKRLPQSKKEAVRGGEKGKRPNVPQVTLE